ncbi:MAG: nuclear transport factor 2 family protein [Phycisphaerae bacterium]|nr:nuclear transport factor 2 family protein [Phycisphaerae bacterium]
MKDKKQSKKDTQKAKKQHGDTGVEAPPAAAASGMPKFKHVAKKKLSTGKGATAEAVGKSLVQLFNTGKLAEVEKLWHHKQIESIEADGSVFEGKKGVAEKNAWWYANFEVHSSQAEGPFVGATGFTVHFTLDATPKGGARMSSREVGVYTVSKGKIVREEFMALSA